MAGEPGLAATVPLSTLNMQGLPKTERIAAYPMRNFNFLITYYVAGVIFLERLGQG